MNKSNLEAKLHHIIQKNPFTSAQCYNYLALGPKNNLINDRYLYNNGMNTNTTSNFNLNMISPNVAFQRRDNINDPNIYNNSQLNPLYCTLTSLMNGDLNNNPLITHYNSIKYYKKKPFSPEEDEVLLNLVETQGIGNWQKISIKMKNYNFDRNGRQCRDRYYHYLDPSIKMNCDWTPEEDSLILKYVEKKGKKWKGMEKNFPGRTEVSLRNRYNLLMRKKVKEQKKTGKKEKLSFDTKNCEIPKKPSIDQLSKEKESFHHDDFNDSNNDYLFDATFNLENLFEESLF